MIDRRFNYRRLRRLRRVPLFCWDVAGLDFFAVSVACLSELVLSSSLPEEFRLAFIASVFNLASSSHRSF